MTPVTITRDVGPSLSLYPVTRTTPPDGGTWGPTGFVDSPTLDAPDTLAVDTNTTRVLARQRLAVNLYVPLDPRFRIALNIEINVCQNTRTDNQG